MKTHFKWHQDERKDNGAMTKMMDFEQQDKT
jgi:hypothetical protein